MLAIGFLALSTGATLAVAPAQASTAAASGSSRAVATHVVAHPHSRHRAAKLPVKPPMDFTIGAVPGPRAGQTTITWKQVKTRWKTRTTGFNIQTSLTKFGPYGHGLPKAGRHYHVFRVGSDKRQFVMGPRQLAEAGASLASANHLYFRVYSVDNPRSYPESERKKYGKGIRQHTNGQMGAAVVKGMAPTGAGPEMTFASFNVRGVSVDNSGQHMWINRRALVGQQIIKNQPGIVAMQELLPTIKNGLRVRQTTDLVDWLHGNGGGQYQLVRENPYSAATGTQQGMRILYDSDKYTLLSKCSDPDHVSDSERADCIIRLPQRLPGDAVRWAAYAQFAPQGMTGATSFWVVSMHLGVRATHTTAELASDNRVRRAQVETILSKMSGIMAAANASGQPIILAGDMNDWQNNSAPDGYAAHDYLVSHGFYDTAAAVRQTNMAYPTVNHFELKKAADGRGFRYDAILTRGMRGATSFLNDITRYGGQWPSDHDMVVAKFNLP